MKKRAGFIKTLQTYKSQKNKEKLENFEEWCKQLKDLIREAKTLPEYKKASFIKLVEGYEEKIKPENIEWVKRIICEFLELYFSPETKEFKSILGKVNRVELGEENTL